MGVCNAPYARVLRARVARIRAHFARSCPQEAMALIVRRRHKLAARRTMVGLKSLISIGNIWLPQI